MRDEGKVGKKKHGIHPLGGKNAKRTPWGDAWEFSGELRRKKKNGEERGGKPGGGLGKRCFSLTRKPILCWETEREREKGK